MFRGRHEARAEAPDGFDEWDEAVIAAPTAAAVTARPIATPPLAPLPADARRSVQVTDRTPSLSGKLSPETDGGKRLFFQVRQSQVH